jgi:stage II sporulation protein R
MMKKLVFFVFICFIVFLSIPAQVVSQKDNANVKEDFQVIPDEAIRLRILAHSDNQEDQTLKRLVRDRVNEEITTWVEEITDIEQARQIIEQRIPEVESIVKEVLEES